MCDGNLSELGIIAMLSLPLGTVPVCAREAQAGVKTMQETCHNAELSFTSTIIDLIFKPAKTPVTAATFFALAIVIEKMVSTSQNEVHRIFFLKPRYLLLALESKTINDLQPSKICWLELE